MENSQCNLRILRITIFIYIFSVDDLVLALYPPTDHQAVVENVSIWDLQIVIDFNAGKRCLRCRKALLENNFEKQNND